MSQAKLGEIIGVSSSSISTWETGASEPSLGALIKLSDFFMVSIDYLAGRENSK